MKLIAYPAAIAQIHMGLGNKDRPSRGWKKAYEERSNFMAYIRVGAMADPLRSDPPFAELVLRIGLAP